MDTIKRQALQQSIIELRRQCEKLEEMIADGTTKRWGGTSPRRALITSAQALTMDVIAFQDSGGADEWSESHRQYAKRILKS